MNDVEHRLQRALRPVSPPEGFAERVMRALPERHPPANVVPLSVVRNAPPASRWRRFSAPAALAASLVVAVFAGRHVAVQHMETEERAGLAASRELMQALRVTSQKLDLAYEAVQRPAPPKATPEQENRS
jgi:hypothetical protein